jgi:predicted amidophosphoribosyltransferase
MNLDYENLSTDYEDRCGNCQSFMDESDKYCKYCGTEVYHGNDCCPKCAAIKSRIVERPNRN